MSFPAVVAEIRARADYLRAKEPSGFRRNPLGSLASHRWGSTAQTRRRRKPLVNKPLVNAVRCVRHQSEMRPRSKVNHFADRA